MSWKNNISILFASRLVHEKWVDILIDVIKKISIDPLLKDKIYWNICSDWSEVQKIEKLTEKYPDIISYYGKVSQKELAELYRKNDLLFMPSRFLETFWLTALEALASWIPVYGFSKWWLREFIPAELSIDPIDPVSDFIKKCTLFLEKGIPNPLDVSLYSQEIWIQKLGKFFSGKQKIAIVHDYKERIGGAEYYIEEVATSLKNIWKEVQIFSYTWKTSVWKRRFLFIFSSFAFQRYFQMHSFLRKNHPEVIWMHSVLRYVGFWWILAVKSYKKRNPSVEIFLSHHDVGLIAAYPQYITRESEIPKDSSLSSFIPKNLSKPKQFQSIFKWFYIRLLRFSLPKNLKHMVFSSFLVPFVSEQFPEDEVLLFPHSVDTQIFYP